MATTVGNLQEFRPTDEGIAAYLERVELYFKANDIAERKQVPVFLTVVGGKVYALLRDLLAPEKPDTKSFQELAQTLKTHLIRAQAASYCREILLPLAQPEGYRVHCRIRGRTTPTSDAL